MAAQEEKTHDPLIDEVREWRRQLLEEHGGDLRRLLKTIQEQQSQNPEKVFDRRKKKAFPA